MSDVALAVIVVIAVALVMAALALLAVRVRRRATAGPAIGAAMAAYDEAMHSTAHATFVEMQAEADRVKPAPTPDER